MIISNHTQRWSIETIDSIDNRPTKLTSLTKLSTIPANFGRMKVNNLIMC